MDIRYVSSKGFYIDKWIRTLFIWLMLLRYADGNIGKGYFLADFIFKCEECVNIHYVSHLAVLAKHE